MAGTRAGGLKARDTNKKNHGSDFYARIGRIGGQNGHTGGFASNPQLAKIAGAKGGRRSKRGKASELRFGVYDMQTDELLCRCATKAIAENRIRVFCQLYETLRYDYYIAKLEGNK